jgi:hypothetical protein
MREFHAVGSLVRAFSEDGRSPYGDRLDSWKEIAVYLKP